MTLTLIYGGTFDPVHNGHIHVARQLLSLFDEAQLSLVPCRNPVHRGEPSASPEDRMAMLELAVADELAISADACELEREGPSYSIDTLMHYRHQLGEQAPIGFVMGMDSWETLPTWHEWEQLSDFAHLIVVSRPGHARPGYPRTMTKELKTFSEGKVTENKRGLMSQPSGLVYFAELPESDVSATQVRQVLQKEKDVSQLTPAGVNEYIVSHQLYQAEGLARRDNG